MMPSSPLFDLCSSTHRTLSPKEVVLQRFMKKLQREYYEYGQSSNNNNNQQQQQTSLSKPSFLEFHLLTSNFFANLNKSSSTTNSSSLQELLDARPAEVTLETLEGSQMMCPILFVKGVFGSFLERLQCPDPAEVLPFLS